MKRLLVDWEKPAVEIRLIRERGPSNIQLSSSNDLTTLFKEAIRSDFRTVKQKLLILLWNDMMFYLIAQRCKNYNDKPAVEF